MSERRQGEAAAAEQSTPPAQYRSYAEQQLFDLSPVNLWITAALIYAVLVGGYIVCARLDGVAWLVRSHGGVALTPNARLALVLPLIFCASLALQRFSRLRELADGPAFARAMLPGVSWSNEFSRRQLKVATAIGAAAGLASALAIAATELNTGPSLRATPIWFALVAVLLGALFFRGVALTRAAAAHTRAVIETGLQIDLLRIDLLYPWGRAAARTSLVWFTVCAVTLLLFVSSGFTLYTLAILAGCGAMGLWVFVGTMSQMHHRIRTAKAAELDGLRTEIAGLRRRLDTDTAAAAKLQSLLAFEARIASAPEWPFDQTILVRVGVSSLILMIPWFGQAVAGLVVDRASLFH